MNSTIVLYVNDLISFWRLRHFVKTHVCITLRQRWFLVYTCVRWVWIIESPRIQSFKNEPLKYRVSQEKLYSAGPEKYEATGKCTSKSPRQATHMSVKFHAQPQPDKVWFFWTLHCMRDWELGLPSGKTRRTRFSPSVAHKRRSALICVHFEIIDILQLSLEA